MLCRIYTYYLKGLGAVVGDFEVAVVFLLACCVEAAALVPTLGFAVPFGAAVGFGVVEGEPGVVTLVVFCCVVIVGLDLGLELDTKGLGAFRGTVGLEVETDGLVVFCCEVDEEELEVDDLELLGCIVGLDGLVAFCMVEEVGALEDASLVVFSFEVGLEGGVGVLPVGVLPCRVGLNGLGVFCCVAVGVLIPLCSKVGLDVLGVFCGAAVPAEVCFPAPAFCCTPVFCEAVVAVVLEGVATELFVDGVALVSLCCSAAALESIKLSRYA